MWHENVASGLMSKVGRGRRKGRRRPAFRPCALTLEDRRLPATIVPIPQSNPRVALSTIFWNGEAQPLNPNGVANVQSPEAAGAAKTITITNNGPSMIYPFLRGQNNGDDPNASPKAPYDPQDVVDHEFRQYVGYSGPAGRQYLGLPSGASITFQVPLALWDGDNLYLATDGTKLTSSAVFGYDPKASITVAATSPVSNSTWVTGSSGYQGGLKPLVMFYFSGGAPITLPNDAPAQLTEVTFRDPYLKNFINDANQTFPLINYDVSYVNNLLAPVAMQASQVPITYGSQTAPTYYGAKDFGWLATTKTTAAFQPLISGFISGAGRASVGSYFTYNTTLSPNTPRGWPQYYNPNQAIDVIPSGANLFANSPLNKAPALVHTSSYDPNRWLLTSNTTAPIQAGGAGVGQQGFTNDAFPQRLYLGQPTPRFVSDLRAMLAAGPVNLSYPGSTDVLATVTGYNPNPDGRPFVTLKGTIPSSGPSGKVYAFTRSASDYAVTAITNLWYSWAQYYVQHYQNAAPATAPASTNLDSDGNITNMITVPAGSFPAGIAVGWGVGADSGLPDGTTVLRIDGNNIYLSRIPAVGTTTQDYTFTKPVALAYDPKYTTPYTISFDNANTPNAVLFAGSVYEAMSVEGSVNPLPDSYLPDAMNIVSQVIQFYAKIPDYDRAGLTGSSLVGQVRDVVKSILRGVYDFNKVPDQNQWYPQPNLKPAGLTSNQTFNVFNLDPYVWFVHDVLQMSAYGFSVDDDVSNPTATGPLVTDTGTVNHAPNNLQIQFSGPGGLGNPNQWFPTIPWGTIQTTGTLSFYNGSNPKYTNAPIVTINARTPREALTFYNMINNPGDGQVGATISAPGYLPAGTQLVHKGPTSGTIPEIVLLLPPGTTMTPSPGAVPITITA